MSDNISNNKRIAKNTIILYIRMVFMMLISLYTSRIVLKTLGVVDYGVYNVVGSIVSMFSVITNAMSSAVQRFLMIEVGRNIQEQIQKVFATSNTIFMLISLTLFVFAESIGLYLFHNLDIPEASRTGAMWVYQCALISTIVIVMSVPYNALIISFEKFAFYGYISILEACLKLGITFSLFLFPNSYKLTSYAILLLLSQIIVRTIYTIFCKRIVSFVYFQIIWEKNRLFQMMSFSGYRLLWEIAYMFSTLGVNYMLNIFFGPIANAARGIAVQVQSAIFNLVGNFQSALRPQLVKNYASKNFEYTRRLIITGSKLTLTILVCMILPLIFNIHIILAFWLVNYPPITEGITILVLIECIFEKTTVPLEMAMEANGSIKKYQIIQSSILILSLPLCYFSYNLGAREVYGFIIILLLRIGVFFVRTFVISRKIGIGGWNYLYNIVIKMFIPIIISTIFCLFTMNYNNSILFTLLVIICNSFLFITLVYIFSLNKYEKNIIKKTFIKKQLPLHNI